MKAYLSARLGMMRGIIGVSNAHTAAWSSFAPFAAPFAQLVAGVAQANALIPLAMAGTTGAAAGKRASRADLCAMVLRLSRALKLWAQLNANSSLAASAHCSSSALRNMKDLSLKGFAAQLLELAAALPAGSLDGLGANAAFIAAMQAGLDAFSAVINAPRDARSQVAEANRALLALIRQLTALLKEELDAAIDILAYQQPAFATEYRGARQIKDPGFRRRALSVVVRDEETGAPLQGIGAQIMPGDISRQSGKMGGFYVPRMKEGAYLLKLSGAGYAAKEMPFVVIDRQNTVVEVRLSVNSV